MKPTKEQLKAGLNVILAVTEAIREAGEIPAGTLYAVLCGKVDMQGFDKIVSIVTGSGLVEKHGDLLRWVGPELKGANSHELRIPRRMHASGS